MKTMEKTFNITKGTHVTFPMGITSGFSTVLFATENYTNLRNTLVVTDETPFHPLDNKWSDQPADMGKMIIEGLNLPVVDALTAAINLQSGQLYVDSEIPVRSGEAGWAFVVAHVATLPPQCDTSRLLGRSVY